MYLIYTILKILKYVDSIQKESYEYIFNVYSYH